MRTPRPAFTLLELVLVLALLLVLGAFAVPTLSGLSGNARQKAAADVIHARMADARGRAIEFGGSYRLAVHTDGTRVRLAPEGNDFGELPAAELVGATTRVSEDKLDKATAEVQPADPDVPAPTADPAGWVTVATFLPDGTCREGNVIVAVNETGYPPLRILVRGITGRSRALPAERGN